MIDPFENCEEVVVSDTEDLVNVSRALYIPSDGDLAVITAGGSDVIFQNLVGGTFIPGRFRRVLSTGTTVTGTILSCY